MDEAHNIKNYCFEKYRLSMVLNLTVFYAKNVIFFSKQKNKTKQKNKQTNKKNGEILIF